MIGYVDEQPWSLLPSDDFYPISSIRLEDQQTVDNHLFYYQLK